MSAPEKMWLEPECAEANPEGRLWSEDHIEDCDEDGCGCKAVEYTRADLIQPQIDAAYRRGRDEAIAEFVLKGCEQIMHVTDSKGALVCIVNGDGTLTRGPAWRGCDEAAAVLSEWLGRWADTRRAGYVRGLEDAAKLCDAIAGNTKDFNADRRRAAGQCSAAIRALAKPEDAQ